MSILKRYINNEIRSRNAYLVQILGILHDLGFVHFLFLTPVALQEADQYVLEMAACILPDVIFQ